MHIGLSLNILILELYKKRQRIYSVSMVEMCRKWVEWVGSGYNWKWVKEQAVEKWMIEKRGMPAY